MTVISPPPHPPPTPNARHIDTRIVPVRPEDRTTRYRHCINSESLSYRIVSYCSVTTRGNYDSWSRAPFYSRVRSLSRTRVPARLPRSSSRDNAVSRIPDAWIIGKRSPFVSSEQRNSLPSVVYSKAREERSFHSDGTVRMRNTVMPT